MNDGIPFGLPVQDEMRNFETLNLFQPPPPVDWVVEDVVVGGEATLLVADGGAGKSFFALALSLAVAGGEPFLDCWTKQGRVMYIDEEGSAALALQRLDQLGATEQQRNYLDYLNFAGVDLAQHPERLISDVKLAHPVLVVIDSHAKATKMAEENSNSEMNRVWDNGILRLARSTGAGVLVIHHTSAFPGGSPRGATAIRNSADQVLTMQKQIDGSQVVFPSKPRRPTHGLHFDFLPTPMGGYEFVPHCDY